MLLRTVLLLSLAHSLKYSEETLRQDHLHLYITYVAFQFLGFKDLETIQGGGDISDTFFIGVGFCFGK